MIFKWKNVQIKHKIKEIKWLQIKYKKLYNLHLYNEEKLKENKNIRFKFWNQTKIIIYLLETLRYYYFKTFKCYTKMKYVIN